MYKHPSANVFFFGSQKTTLHEIRVMRIILGIAKKNCQKNSHNTDIL